MSRPSPGAVALVVVAVVAVGLLATVEAPKPESEPPDMPTGTSTSVLERVEPAGTATPTDSPASIDSPASAGPPSSQGWTVPTTLATLVVGGTVVAVLAAVVRGAVHGSDGGGDAPVAVDESTGDPDEASDAGESEAALDGVGDAAGAAADRIEADAGFENEVYRAYHELTRLLGVERAETLAPDEFADRAARAGMAPEHVRDLTRLFEEVRYGERDPGSREERAVAVLRRIETAYADESAGGRPPDSAGDGSGDDRSIDTAGDGSGDDRSTDTAGDDADPRGGDR